jgi:glutamate dehydrogenase
LVEVVHYRKERRQARWYSSRYLLVTLPSTVGLPPKLIPIDGMTSLSVRQYILGVLKAHGLNEKDVTKFQTGGPDGDLGSSTSSALRYWSAG